MEELGGFSVSQLASIAEEQPLLGFACIVVGNTLVSSIIPIPLGYIFCLLAGFMYGSVVGSVVYISTCALGGWFTFLLTRLLRPCIMSQLGKHLQTWERIDTAIMREGVVICVLWRIAPIAPYVLSSVLISMTAISQFDFVWTTTAGIIPSTLPIVSVGALGRSLASGDAGMLQVAVNVVSILAGIYVVIRLVAVAQSVFKRNEMGDPISMDPDESAAGDSRAETALL
eukprot:CAMPEP_0183341550 /NCGR_PEP_ID=MMETSP0164_2-20130417/7808_1 /TAXON_ID=221442 /ORGANISM="Coccolithus pelagicus ssp braarudi, Strain PLY182g" /LENGTH=227 /DNA_ID=CAMNT_0025511911 /DNA_START=9 /DNA_END=692 /DNA_ORIENTATION=-